MPIAPSMPTKLRRDTRVSFVSAAASAVVTMSVVVVVASDGATVAAVGVVSGSLVCLVRMICIPPVAASSPGRTSLCNHQKHARRLATPPWQAVGKRDNRVSTGHHAVTRMQRAGQVAW
jgi:hypothetical protein